MDEHQEAVQAEACRGNGEKSRRRLAVRCRAAKREAVVEQVVDDRPGNRADARGGNGAEQMRGYQRREHQVLDDGSHRADACIAGEPQQRLAHHRWPSR
jgi:hypothetical protein